MATNGTNGVSFYPRDHVRIALEHDEVSVNGSWHEASVSKKLDSGEKLSALIPVRLLGPDKSSMPAQVLTVEGDKVLLALPVGNEGGSTWGIPRDELAKMLVKH